LLCRSDADDRNLRESRLLKQSRNQVFDLVAVVPETTAT